MMHAKMGASKMGTVKTGGDRRDGIAKTGRTAVLDANKTKGAESWWHG
jgi:hypothetical protein